MHVKRKPLTQKELEDIDKKYRDILGDDKTTGFFIFPLDTDSFSQIREHHQKTVMPEVELDFDDEHNFVVIRIKSKEDNTNNGIR